MGFTVKQWHKYERDRMLALQNPPKAKVVHIVNKVEEPMTAKEDKETEKYLNGLLEKHLKPKKKKPSKVSIDNKVRKLKDKWRKR
jgi:hypothetical protein